MANAIAAAQNEQLRSGNFCSAVFCTGVVFLDLLGGHYVLELRPETFNLAEFIPDLALVSDE